MSISNTLGLRSKGHALFALTMVGIGVLGLIQGDFTPTWNALPKSTPAREAFVYITAIVSLVSGVLLLVPRAAIIAARTLLVSFLLWLVLVRLPYIYRGPTSTGAWWETGDSAAMAGAAWVLFVWFAKDWDRQRFGFATGAKGLRLARVFFGLGLIPFGVAHFTYLDRTQSMVPSYLPFHTAWAVLTGSAFIVAGVAIATGVYARLAALLVTLQMAGFTILVWIPIITKTPTAGDWTEFVGSWVLVAAGSVVVDSYRASPSS